MRAHLRAARGCRPRAAAARSFHHGPPRAAPPGRSPAASWTLELQLAGFITWTYVGACARYSSQRLLGLTL